MEETITILEVTKRFPKPGCTIILICENRFNSFDFVPLATLRFEIF